MLVSVEVALRCSPALRDLEVNCWIITGFLGPPPNMSLSDACSRGSIELLDWIWNSSCTSVDHRAPRWSLTNYLRSEPLYYSCQFSKSLVVAARQGNLEIVEWIFAHFSNCAVGAGVACQAAMNGHLHVLEFLWTYTEEYEDTPPYKKQKVAAGGAAAVNSCHDNARNFVDWDDGIILTAAEHGHFDIVRWLYKNTPLQMYMYDWAYGLVIKLILCAGDDELVQLLLPPGRCVLDYAGDCPRVEVIEWMLDCGYLRRNASLAMDATQNLAKSGRVVLIQQIVQQHSPLPEQYVQRWSLIWCGALTKASRCGALPTVQWLVMQQRIPLSQGIVQAAAEGNLAMVKFLLGFKPQEFATEPIQKNLVPANAWRAQPRGLLAAAAASGNFELVKWVQVNHPGQSATNAINSAAMNGHLHVVKWLQEDRTEAFTEIAMYAAAAGGNLPMVKWIHSNGFTGYVPDAVDEAARRGYLDVVKWFYANRPERCTARGFGDNTRNGPLRVADWLHTNAPNHVPANLDGTRDSFYPRKFELLLFMDARCPQCFTPQFVKDTKKYLKSYTLLEELRWLNARFPKVKETK